MASARRSCISVLLSLACGCAAFAATAAERLDAPVIWYEDDRAPIERPAERDPNLIWDMIDDAVVLPVSRNTDPVRLGRRIAGLFGDTEAVGPAANVNALDETPNSTWFTNRIGLRPLSVEEIIHGFGRGLGPDRSAPWTVISAKTQGVTPGFAVRDAAGSTFMVKFDPPGHLGMTTTAGVISGRILHAAGYNVPDDVTVTFRPEDIVLGEGVKIKDKDGRKRPMTRGDLDAILASVERLPDGRCLAITSRWIDGRPIGPFSYRGRREDDPNDRVSHQHRRELRGLRMFAAWLHHFDTKQHNSLDAYDPGGYVKHYLIDFASTLGAGANGPTPRYGYEFTFDLPAMCGRALSLGFAEDGWRRIALPGRLPEVGYWESEEFDPFGFDPLQPNTAFANCTRRDAYWAAKIISAFTDAQLEAICDTAGYADPAAGEWVARILAERRDKIARVCFDLVPPLDFFSAAEGRLAFRDLGVERGVYPAAATRYRARAGLADVERRVIVAGDWLEFDDAARGLDPAPRARALPGRELWPRYEIQVDRGEGWSASTVVYRDPRAGRVVAVER